MRSTSPSLEGMLILAAIGAALPSAYTITRGRDGCPQPEQPPKPRPDNTAQQAAISAWNARVDAAKAAKKAAKKGQP